MSDEQRAKELFLAGLDQLDAKHLDMAEKNFRAALELAPGRPSILTNLAVTLAERGAFAEALKLARQALAADPDNNEAILTGALAASGVGDADQALALWDEVLKRNIDKVRAHAGMAMAYRQKGMNAEALAAYDRVLRLEPGHFEAHINRGNILFEQSRPADALAHYRLASATRPSHAGAWLAVGNARLALARLARAGKPTGFDGDHATLAVDAFRKAQQLDRASPEIWYGLGMALVEKGERVEAVQAFDRGLALTQDHAGLWVASANLLFEIGRFVEAGHGYERASQLEPDRADALVGIGNVEIEIGRAAEALATMDRAIALDPELKEAWNGRGNALRDLERPDEAIAAFDRAVALDPRAPLVLVNRARARTDLADFAAADRDLASALAIDPENADARLALATTTLLQGDLAGGLDLYEARKELALPLGTRGLAQAHWQAGEPLEGRTIFVHHEQQFGDTLQFVRYLKPLAERGAKVILSAPNDLKALLEPAISFAEIIDETANPQAFDCQAAMMSLPRAFADTLPLPYWDGPYLWADGERIARWRARIGETGFRVGVAPSAGPLRAAIGLSFPEAGLAPLAALPGVRLIDLQGGLATEADAAAGVAVEPLATEFEPGSAALLDVAAALHSLDLVITADTALAHLAGALGRPVWLVLKHVPDWRWGMSSDKTAWYPTMTLFRQAARGDWSAPFAAMEAALGARLA